MIISMIPLMIEYEVVEILNKSKDTLKNSMSFAKTKVVPVRCYSRKFAINKGFGIVLT
jgi:hypothetical protein